uniref:Fork-head domain-containing protein n=1 Tax=Parastrongyloides trichosuri TaxID=131310 RepID=A0A0N4ZB18_PARTI
MDDVYKMNDFVPIMTEDITVMEASNEPTDPHFSMALCLANSVLRRSVTKKDKNNGDVAKFEPVKQKIFNNFTNSIQNKGNSNKELETHKLSISEYDSNFTTLHNCTPDVRRNYENFNYLGDKDYWKFYSNNGIDIHENNEEELHDGSCYFSYNLTKDKTNSLVNNYYPQQMNNCDVENKIILETLESYYNPNDYRYGSFSFPQNQETTEYDNDI